MRIERDGLTGRGPGQDVLDEYEQRHVGQKNLVQPYDKDMKLSEGSEAVLD